MLLAARAQKRVLYRSAVFGTVLLLAGCRAPLRHLDEQLAPPDASTSSDGPDAAAVDLCGDREADGGLGSGTAADPFVICDAEALNGIGADPTLMDKAFVLGRDLELSGLTYREIGSAEAPFRGEFDGRGHVLANMQITTSGGTHYHGMFRETAGARIRNLVLERWSAESQVSFTGAVVGTATDTELSNLRVEVNFAAGDAVGGVLGLVRGGSIEDVQVSGEMRVGALSDGVGGLAGSVSELTVRRCGSTVDLVNASGNSDISAIGGLIGGASATTVSDAYARGSVTFVAASPKAVGGLIGSFNGGRVERVYSTGPVVVAAGSGVGGLFGNQSGEVQSAFWDAEVSGISTGPGGTGLATAAMKTASTFRDAGWSEATWLLVDGSYPELRR